MAHKRMHSSQAPQPTPQLTEIWRTRLDKAKAAYDLAVAEFRRTAEECRFREAASPETEAALRRAVAGENSARNHYLRVLHAFTELVVGGRIPPEN